MKYLIISFAALLFVTLASADTTYVSGTIVLQTWTPAGSPYLVMGDILVASLTIQPGVEVIFQGNYVFEIGGALTAIGTQEDSIIFTKASTSSGWQGILFNLSPPGSTLAYCLIEGSINRGLRIINCDATIRNCRVRGNSGPRGAGIDIIGNAVLTACAVENNVVSLTGNGNDAKGGGIYAQGNLTLSNCIFRGNRLSAVQSTGDYVTVQSMGGGAYVDGVSRISNCTFSHNYAYAYAGNLEYITSRAFGAGLYVAGSSEISNSIFAYDTNYANATGYYAVNVSYWGAGAYAAGPGKILFTNCTFAYNSPRAIRGEGDSTIVENSILYFNYAPNGIQISGTANASYSDIQNGYTGFGNIDRNPVFGSPANLQIVPGSSCVDAGDSTSAYNDACFPPSLGSPRNDMGAHGGPNACGWDPPRFKAVPLTIDFGEVPLGSSKKDSVMVTNAGATQLIITSISSTDGQFTVAPTGSVVAPTEVQKFYVTFRPTTAAVIIGSLFFSSNAGTGSDTIRLNGVGVFPVFSFDTSDLDIDSVRVGSSRTDTASVTNTGTGQLKITSILVDGGDFTVTPETAIILPSISRKFSIRFAPSSIGLKTSNIRFISNASTSPDTLRATGIGVSPVFTSNRLAVTFGYVEIGASATDSIVVSNPGNMELTISRAVTNQPEFLVLPESASVLPLGSTSFQISFRPTYAGTKSGHLIFYHDAPDTPDTVNLSGIAVPASTDTMSWILNPISKPFAYRHFGYVTNGEYVFTLGGDSIRYPDYVMRYVGFTKIQPDGSLGNWTTATTLPYRLSNARAAIHGNNLYVIGGRDSANAIHADVFRTVIGQDGMLSNWESQAALPAGHYGHSVVVKDSLMYVLGGINDPTVHYSKIGSDGNISSWNYTTSMPTTGLYGTGAVVHGNRIFVLGGAMHVPDFRIVRTVQYADILLNGELGNWITTDSMPDARWFHGVAIYQNKILVVGGGYVNTAMANVSEGTINVDGQIAWNTIGAVPLASIGGGLLITNNTAYYLTGESQLFETRTEIYYARMILTEIVNGREMHIPPIFSLSQNYPNPFNPSTRIRYALPTESFVSAKVFDVLGREVATLVNEKKNSGSYEVEFDGSRLSSGIYFYRLQAGSYVDTKKLILMR